MFLKNIFCSILFLSFFTTVFSQDSGAKSPTDLPNIISPSPTVAGLMKVEETPIDFYTGQPNISIPLFQKTIGNNLGYNLSLNYHTSNLKLSERSGWAGVSWSLSGEALISRSVRGIPDELNLSHPSNVTSSDKKVGVLHNGYFNIDWDNFDNYSYPGNTYARTSPANEEWIWNASGFGSGRFGNIGSFDKDLDLYQINIFGTTGRFVIVKNSSNELVVKFLSNEANLKVELDYDATTYEISRFIVINESGVKIYLDQKEETDSTIVTLSQSQNGFDRPHSQDRTKAITAWKVSDVFSSSGVSLASFEYLDVNEKYSAPISKRINYLNQIQKDGLVWLPGTASNIYYDLFTNSRYPDGEIYVNQIAHPKQSFSWSNVNVDTKKIQKVVFRDGVEIDFSIVPGHQEYNASGSYLDKITILNNNTDVNKSFVFEYNISPTLTNANRLFLEKIKQYNSDNSDSMDYRISYNSPELLPHIEHSNTITSNKVDIWNYYKEPPNSFQSIVNSIHENSADENTVTIGSIKEIIYPTGGKKSFEFESNKISSLGYRDLTDEEFIDINPNNSSYQFQDLIYDSCNGNDETISQGPGSLFTIDFKQKVHLSSELLCGDSNSVFLRDLLFKIEGNSGQLIKLGRMDRGAIFELDPGSYVLSFQNILNIGSIDNFRIESKLHYRKSKSNIHRYIAGGGIRIKSVTNYKKENDTASKQMFYYDSSEGSLSLSSSDHYGVMDGFLSRFKEYNLTQNIEYMDYSGTGGNGQDVSLYPATLQYHVKEYSTSPHVTLTKGGYVGYSKVISKRVAVNALNVVNTDDLGSSVFTYTSPKDYPTNSALYFWPFIPTRDFSYKQGLLLLEESYSKEGKLLSENENTYSFIEDELFKTPFIFKNNDCARSIYYSRYQNYLNEIPENTPPGFPSNQYFYGSCDNIISGYGEYASIVNVDHGEYYTKVLLDNTNSRYHFYDSQSNLSNTIETSTDYTYNPNNYQLSRQTITDSKGDVIENQTVYTDFYTDNNNGSGIVSLFEPDDIITYYDMGIDANMKNHPILNRSYLNGELTSTVQYIYKENQNNQFVLEVVKTSKGNEVLEERLNYHRYDQYDNVLDVSKRDGTHVSYIWDHNYSYPIAKIENASYEELATMLNTSVNELEHFSDSSTLNKSSIDGLRSNFTVESPFMITTYTYKLGIGIETVTDPRGRTMTYHYDDFNRLEHVTDHEGNIVSKNEYKYATQN